MKILVLADTHFRKTNPENRIDDYWETLKKKWLWVLDLYKKENCELILHAGDFFDAGIISNDVVTWLIRTIKENSIDIYGVIGQHDMIFRHFNDSCSLAIMFESKAIKRIGNGRITHPEIDIYGCDFGKEIPKIKTRPLPIVKTILVTHRLISDKDYWHGNAKFETPDSLLKLGFNYVISGDNHKSFVSGNNRKALVNCGSMARSDIDQVEHKPCVYIIDTDKPLISKYLIPIERPEKVFLLEEKTKDKQINKNMESLVNKLSENKKIELSFEKNVEELSKDSDEEVKSILEEAMIGKHN